jgi:hypothetical protein
MFWFILASLASSCCRNAKSLSTRFSATSRAFVRCLLSILESKGSRIGPEWATISSISSTIAAGASPRGGGLLLGITGGGNSSASGVALELSPVRSVLIRIGSLDYLIPLTNRVLRQHDGFADFKFELLSNLTACPMAEQDLVNLVDLVFTEIVNGDLAQKFR